MRPFPEAVQKAFSCALGRLAERPWWQYEQYYDGEPHYRREDGSIFVVPPKIDQIAGIDAEHPLPHPGYRAGQIWAAVDGGSTVITQVSTYRHGVGIWSGHTSYWHTGEEFQEVWPYLVADPACPHLAPWSPVEEK